LTKKSPLDHDCHQLVGIYEIQGSLVAVKKFTTLNTFQLAKSMYGTNHELAYELFCVLVVE
jgi:hypothetical protein